MNTCSRDGRAVPVLGMFGVVKDKAVRGGVTDAQPVRQGEFGYRIPQDVAMIWSKVASSGQPAR